MLSHNQIDHIEHKWNVTVLESRADADATHKVGFLTYCVAAEDPNSGEGATLYVALKDGVTTLMWDVSGYPSWFTE